MAICAINVHTYCASNMAAQRRILRVSESRGVQEAALANICTQLSFHYITMYELPVVR